MTEIEPIRLLGKLDFMTSYLDRLKAYEAVTLEEYLADRDKQLIVERLLQLIIQVTLKTAYIDSLEAESEL